MTWTDLLFTERGVAALVVSTSSSGQWHEMTVVTMSDMCKVFLWTARVSEVNPPRTFVFTKSLLVRLRLSITDCLAIAFLVSATDAVHNASWATCRGTAKFPNPLMETHITGVHISSDITMVLPQVQLKTTCCELCVCTNVREGSCGLTLEMIARCHQSDSVSAEEIVTDDFTVCLSDTSESVCLNCVGTRICGRVFMRVSFQTQMIHLRVVFRT